MEVGCGRKCMHYRVGANAAGQGELVGLARLVDGFGIRLGKADVANDNASDAAVGFLKGHQPT